MKLVRTDGGYVTDDGRFEVLTYDGWWQWAPVDMFAQDAFPSKRDCVASLEHYYATGRYLTSSGLEQEFDASALFY